VADRMTGRRALGTVLVVLAVTALTVLAAEHRWRSGPASSGSAAATVSAGSSVRSAPPPVGHDASLAAQVAAGMMTASGTATWVRGTGRAVMAALYPGEPGLLGDAQPAVDAANLLVVFTDEHVNGVHPGPPGHYAGPARAAASLVDADTGAGLGGTVWEPATDAGTGRDDSRDDAHGGDPVARWLAGMASLGPLHTVRVAHG